MLASFSAYTYAYCVHVEESCIKNIHKTSKMLLVLVQNIKIKKLHFSVE